MKLPGKLLKAYIRKICDYEIKDASGHNNICINSIDAAIYTMYIAITIITLWTTKGITTLPFFATVLLVCRSFLKQFSLAHKIKKSGNTAPAYSARCVAYAITILFISIVYLSSSDESIGKILLTICYGIFALYEYTDLLIDCYDATPKVYKPISGSNS